MDFAASAVLEEIRQNGRFFFNKNSEALSLLLSDYREEYFAILLDGLNMTDTGLKQPCTVLAVILKVCRMNPKRSLELLDGALVAKQAPRKYLLELAEKTRKMAEKADSKG